MFEVNKDNGAVTMHRGDTGAYYVTFTRGSGQEFGEDDRAIYTVKQGETIIMEREHRLDNTDLGNGRILIAFRNSDTDSLAAGTYNTEVRVAIDPTRASGEIRDGSTIRTPPKLKSTLTILDVLKEI